MTVLAPPLNGLSRAARPYPADMLHPGETGLCLFAAAFLGVNDAIHMARKDMDVTCVDINGPRLNEMAHLYPPYWVFLESDAWEFAENAAGEGHMWDVVSVDTFTGDATDRSLRSIELWCSLARRAVTATAFSQNRSDIPGEWRASIFPRSDRASWLVLRRD